MLDDRAVVTKLKAGHDLFLRADWTRYDPAIPGNFHRSGAEVDLPM
jgi:hypothetical protein